MFKLRAAPPLDGEALGAGFIELQAVVAVIGAYPIVSGSEEPEG